MKKLKYFIFLFFLYSCGISKYLPENEYLLQPGELEVSAPDTVDAGQVQSKGDILVAGRTTPKWRVWWHYQKGFPLGLLGKGLGREPVFFRQSQASAIANALETEAENEGFFWHMSDFTVAFDSTARTAKPSYQLQIGFPTYIDSMAYRISDSVVAREIEELSEKTRIELGDQYDLDELRAERQRIERGLRDKGYYYFAAQDLRYLADTVGGRQSAQLMLALADQIPECHLIPQRIRRVRVFEEFERSNDNEQIPFDTIRYNGIEIICRSCPIRADILEETIGYAPEDLYRPGRHERTVRRLADMNMFRYISLNYQEVPTSDSLLDLNIYLTPEYRRTISGEVGLAYNSGRYFGPELGFTYKNRNLLGGAELLTIDGDFSYNFFLGDERFSRIPRSGVYGLGAELRIPRLWVPWADEVDAGLRSRNTLFRLSGRLEALSIQLNNFQTEITNDELTDLSGLLAADSTATAPVSLWQFSASFGYEWEKIAKVKHQFFPLNLTYQNPQVETEELLLLSRSLGITQGLQGLGRLDRMLSVGPSYYWQLDTRKTGPRSHQFFAGIDLDLRFNRVLPVGDNDRGLSAESSQYIQPEFDLRYYWTVVKQIQLATRVHTGVALPFSERAIVPYFDLFTIGGPNSLRGFIPRGLGPGRTAPLENSLLGQNGFGNVLFETQAELRYRPVEQIEFAIFADVGNVWLFRTETEPTEGDFDFSRFRTELASDAGIGIRFDLGFLLVRIDLAKPLRIPSEAVESTPPNDDIRFVLAFGQAF